MAANLIFICGALRSGTSVTHIMLNHHPQVNNPGEYDFFFDAIAANNIPPEINSYHEYLHNHRIFQAKNLTIDPNLDYQNLLTSFVSQLSSQKPILSLNIYRNFHVIPEFFPQAKYIHLIRDPRDVAKSTIGMGWTGNVYFGVNHWLETEKAWQKLLPKLEPHQYIELKFEALIADPALELHKICQFLNIAFTSDMLNYADNTTYKKPDIKLINQWQHKLSDREIELVEFKASEYISQYDYSLCNAAPKAPNQLELYYLWLQNKYFRFKFSSQRYGISLYFLHKISARLNIHAIQTYTNKKIQAIDTKHLK